MHRFLKRFFIQPVLPEALGDRGKQQGFTLIELLVALAIFTVIFGALFLQFDSVLTAKKRLDQRSVLLADTQKALQVLQQDFEQSIPRAIRDEFGELQPAFIGHVSDCEFTRTGWSRSPFTTRPRSDLQRVGYHVEDGRLLRTSWWALDRAGDSEPRTAVVLSGLQDFSLRYGVLQTTGNHLSNNVLSNTATGSVEFVEEWPLPTSQSPALTPPVGSAPSGAITGVSANPGFTTLPVVVEVRFKLPLFGEITRVFRLVTLGS